MTAGAAFWIFMAAYVVCDTYLYSQGHDTLFWEHKTPAELEIQKHQIGANNATNQPANTSE